MKYKYEFKFEINKEAYSLLEKISPYSIKFNSKLPSNLIGIISEDEYNIYGNYIKKKFYGPFDPHFGLLFAVLIHIFLNITKPYIDSALYLLQNNERIKVEEENQNQISKFIRITLALIFILLIHLIIPFLVQFIIFEYKETISDSQISIFIFLILLFDLVFLFFILHNFLTFTKYRGLPYFNRDYLTLNEEEYLKLLNEKLFSIFSLPNIVLNITDNSLESFIDNSNNSNNNININSNNINNINNIISINNDINSEIIIDPIYTSSKKNLDKEQSQRLLDNN